MGKKAIEGGWGDKGSINAIVKAACEVACGECGVSHVQRVMMRCYWERGRGGEEERSRSEESVGATVERIALSANSQFQLPGPVTFTATEKQPCRIQHGPG